MRAQGADEEVLPMLIDTWIDVYVDALADDIEQRKDHTLQLVQDELDGLAIKIEQARDDLELYRKETISFRPSGRKMRYWRGWMDSIKR
jgi:hypothetical protein